MGEAFLPARNHGISALLKLPHRKVKLAEHHLHKYLTSMTKIFKSI